MRFRALKLHHFGPYKGDHEIVFPAHRERNVMVVFGDNMRGKTSLINAIRWALYGRALNRQRLPFALIQLMNRDARSSNDWSMSVTLEFEADGHEYQLHRLVERRPLVISPKTDADFAETLLLRRDGQALPAANIEHEINHFIPEQIARFYLFDADVLQEYELLLTEQSEQARTIKDAIEKVLGVPALTNGRDDSRQLLKQAQHVLATEGRQHKATEDQAKLALQLQIEIDELQADLKKTEASLLEAVNSVADIDKELRESATIQDLMKRAVQLRQRNDDLAATESALRQQRLDILRDAWQDLLLPRVELRRQELIARLNQQRQQIERCGVLKHEIAALERLSDNCSQCGQRLPATDPIVRGERLRSLTEELAAMEPATREIADVSEKVATLSRLRGSQSLAALSRVEAEALRVSIELTRIESELETVEESLRGHPLERIAQLQKQRDGQLMLRGSLEKSAAEMRSAVTTRERKYEIVSKSLTKSSDRAMERSRRAVEVLSALSSIFGNSVDRLRDSLRHRVAQEASAVFRLLTTEKTYQGLEINNNYGLTIVDGLGRDVAVRSAGAEQIVALSLLAALNRTASRFAPVVIDTPFARLDPVHRENIMKFLPDMAEQVVFLVHEGELPLDRLEGIAGRVGAIYRIERETSSHSRLAPVREAAQ